MKYGKVVLAFLALTLPAAGWTATLGTKTVDLDFLITKFDAVAITKVTVGGQQIQAGLGDAFGKQRKAGRPFEADEDWLRNMSIFLTNRTDKVIVCAEIELLFLDTGDGTTPDRAVTTYTITVGQRPEWSMYFRNGTKRTPDPAWKPLSLAPGKTLEIRVADYIDAIQSLVEERMLFSQLTRVFISRQDVYFEDGMRWDAVARGYYVPEPSHPGHYTKLADDFFPGTKKGEAGS